MFAWAVASEAESLSLVAREERESRRGSEAMSAAESLVIVVLFATLMIWFIGMAIVKG
jgi:hypothetical protein